MAYEWTAERRLPVAFLNNACRFKKVALRALEQTDIHWWNAYSSASFSSVMAAVSVGLAVSVRPLSSMPRDLEDIGSRLGLPAMAPVYIELRANNLKSSQQLAEVLRRSSIMVE